MGNEKCVSEKKKNLIGIYFIYGMLFFLFVFKMFFYANEISAVPDQWAQLSYVVYMEKNPDKLIPEFENIKMYEVVAEFEDGNSKILELEEDGTTCYLGHPPVYYKLIQMCDVIEIDGQHIYANITKISYLNILITSVTMLMILYIGYNILFKKNANWVMHFMYATICTCLPLYGYIGSGINNDNLCNVGLVVFFLGVLSYFNIGYSARTYWLIGMGVLISIFSKLTSGLIVILVCIIVATFDVAKNRKAAIVCNKYFATTLPVYFLVLPYFVNIYVKYGSFQPSYASFVTEEEYINSQFYVDETARVSLTFWEDVAHFFKGLLNTWTSTYERFYAVNRTGILAIPFIIVLILFLVHAGIKLYEYVKHRKYTTETISAAFAIAITITILIHFRMHRNTYLAAGYLGGYQARYYMPCLPVIACGGTQLLCDSINRKNAIQRRVIERSVILLSCLMIYADFFYYIYSYYRL